MEYRKTKGITGFLPQSSANPTARYPILKCILATQMLLVKTPNNGYAGTPTKAKLKDDFSFSIYPNPASNTFLLTLNAEEKDYYNSIGQFIQTMYSGNTSHISENYNTGQLQSGIYFVRIESKEITKGIKLSILK